MRSAVPALLALALAACATAPGEQADTCEPSWNRREIRIVEAGGTDERAVAIDCLRAMDRRRLHIGFTLPAGPDCYGLSRIDVDETADAVSVTLFVSLDDNPTAGACADEPVQARTELDLQQPAGGRDLLDGSR